MDTDSVNLRQHDRFTLTPMYTRIALNRANGLRFERLEGHAYDVSEGGIRIELDQPLEPGERVSLQIGLPGEDIDIFASARVVWTNSADDDPGPRRAALQFREFQSRSDRDRLVRFLGSDLCRRAA